MICIGLYCYMAKIWKCWEKVGAMIVVLENFSAAAESVIQEMLYPLVWAKCVCSPLVHMLKP